MQAVIWGNYFFLGPKQEIKEAIEHKQKVLFLTQQSLRHLEIQEAQYGGINVPVHIKNEIIELGNRIQSLEVEIARLKTLAVEDKIPLEEAEYRALLAEVWQKGYLEIYDITKLELARLKFGITSEQANIMESDIRVTLARENFYKIPEIYFETNGLSDEEWIDTALYLSNAIRLDFKTAFDLSMKYLPRKFSDLGDGVSVFVNQNLGSLLSDILRQRNVWKDQEEYHLFKDFMDRLQVEIIQRVQPSHDKEKDTIDATSSRLSTIRPVPPNIDVTGDTTPTIYRKIHTDE